MWLGLLRTHTRHVNHPAVAVLQQVPGLTVDAAGADAVRGEVLGVDGSGLAVTPRRREVLKLQRQTAHVVSQTVGGTERRGGQEAGPGQVQRKTTSRQNPTHISNRNESFKPINEIKDGSISMTMATDTVSNTVRKVRPVLSVTRQAVMQNVPDAGLVPGRKQNTMGLETGSRLTVNYNVSDGTPQSMDTFDNPKNGSQTLFKGRGIGATAFLS